MSFSLPKNRASSPRNLPLACVIALLFSLVAEFFGPDLSPALAAATVSLDPAFTSGFNAPLRSLAIDSTTSQIVVGGFFTSYNGTTINRIVRLNNNGTFDNAFTTNGGTGFNNGVNSAVIQSDGKIVAGGNFTSYNGTTSRFIARLNADGSLDTSFSTNTGISFDTSVKTIAIQSDGKIIAGKIATSYNGTTIRSIARLNADGTLDSTFNSSTFGGDGVNSVAIQSDGKIVVGSSNPFLYNIMRLNSDGSVDSTFNTGSGFNASVISLAIQSNGKIIVGGYFNKFNSKTTYYIARLNSDGSLDTSFKGGFTGSVSSIAIQSDGRIVVGGEFGRRIARLNADGTQDANFNAGTSFNNYVNCVAVQSDGKIIAGGSFTSFNGMSSNYIARLNLPAAAKVAISSLPATASVNNPVSFTLTAQDANGVTFPGFTGPVTLTSTDPNAIFSPPSSYTFTAADNGVKQFTLTFKTAGSQTVTATPTDNTVLPTTSSPVTVNKITSGVSLSLSPASVSVGQNVTLSVVVSASGAMPTGTITVTSPTLNIPGGPVTLVNGVATLNITPAVAGSYSITATYNGDSTYGSSASSPQTLTVSQAVSTVTGSYYHKLTPFRLYDDRLAGTNNPNPPLGTGAGPFKALEVRTLSLAGISGLPASGIKAITANISIVSAGPGAGFVTAFPTTDSTGATNKVPGTANLVWSNPAAASIVSNFATIGVDSLNSFSLFVGVNRADVIIDVTGYYSSDSTGTGTGVYRNVDSTQKTFRLYDSRPAGTNPIAPPLGADDGILAAGQSRILQVSGKLGIPSTASAVVVNLTAVNTSGAAFFNLYPSDAPQPSVASLTFVFGSGSPALVGNLALVPLSADGKLTLAAGGAGSADAIVDVVGYIDTAFTIGSSNGLFTSLDTPTRLLDTRAKGTNNPNPPLGAGLGPQQGGSANVRNFIASGKAGISTNAIALVAQVTLVDTTGPSFIGLYAGPSWPGTVAVASAGAGQLPGNLAIIPLDSAGSFNAIFGPNASNYILDVVGYILN